MERPHRKALFIFRRDLRLEDNLGLFGALESADEVIPAFVFDPRQTDASKNDYFSHPAFGFLLKSLIELDEALQERGSKLYVFKGDPAEVVRDIIEHDDVDIVHVNKDYTPFARKRDKTIADVCSKAGVLFVRHDDATLSPIEEIRTNQGKLYSVFTPFMKKAMEYDVPEPRKNNFDRYFSGTLSRATISFDEFSAHTPDACPVSGGREEGLAMLRDDAYLAHYREGRNIPSEKGTSRLSAHHKFGTISIRETYAHAREKGPKDSQFISELYWRDFYYYIAYHFPIVFKKSFLPWAQYLEWENNKDEFEAWCIGKTGVPIVDAGMRELNETGWMHNRVRMIVASYLTKNLLINWQWGERYFAQHLVDYDPAQNNGGWQWSASVGSDPRPLRIFNPYTQVTKYDPDAEYIRTWVPELVGVPTEKLTDGKDHDFSELADGYPAPLVDQKESYHRAMARYKAAKDTYKKEQG